jgi:hypothetical protein
VARYILLTDEALDAIDDALRVAGVKYHGGKQFDKATRIRTIRRDIRAKRQWLPRPSDKVIDLDASTNFAYVKRLFEPDHTGRFTLADLYYPQDDAVWERVKTSSLMDARDSEARYE